jgi:uncharacterized protein YbjT (DUF2867 family)
MDVVVAGGHGKIGRLLLGMLAERGDRARGLIRNPDHAPDLEAVGAEPVLADMEELEDLGPQVEGADAVVFAAGAGPGSGPARKRTVDYGAALKLIRACQEQGVRRYAIVSAIAAGQPERWPEEMRPYYEAKSDADSELERSGLDYTIVRPGRLSDDPGTGRIAILPAAEHRSEIPREDVAATLLAVLDEPATAGITFDVLGGDTPIAEAIKSLT